MSDPAEVIREALDDPDRRYDMTLPLGPGNTYYDHALVALSELEAERDRLEGRLIGAITTVETYGKHISELTAERDRLKFDNDVLEDDWESALVEAARLREALREVGFVTIHCTHGAKVRRILERAALSHPPQEDDLPESSKFIASGYGKTWDEQGPIPPPPQEDKS